MGFWFPSRIRCYVKTVLLFVNTVFGLLKTKPWKSIAKSCNKKKVLDPKCAELMQLSRFVTVDKFGKPSGQKIKDFDDNDISVNYKD